MRRAVLLLLATAACSVNFDSGQQLFRCNLGDCPSGFECVNTVCLPVAADGGGDTSDGPTNCEPMAHLALSELAFATRSVSFIEIANPTSDVVSLTDNYLSDNDVYFRLPDLANVPNEDLPTVSDFIRRFPPGTTIDPGATLVIAMEPIPFTDEYLKAPDLAIDELEAISPTSGSPTLNKQGESLVLFYWDGSSDLVSDVDVVVWGDPPAGDGFGVKTGQSVDGPDADTDATAYADDVDTVSGSRVMPGPSSAVQRILGEGGTEATGGNGLTGDDESSEDLRDTWSSTDANPGLRSFCDPSE